MFSDLLKKSIAEFLQQADVQMNGQRPWDLQVKDERFFKRIARQHHLGLGESYMEGWWECQKIDEFVFHLLRAFVEKRLKMPISLWLGLIYSKLSHLPTLIINYQTPNRARKVGKQHYDLGNDLFEKMLDKRMNYSCGYWKNTNSLEVAQEAKLQLICDKLQIKSGMRILDIGCGWGGFSKYVAERYDVSVVGVTISKEQAQYAKKVCEQLLVDIRLQDYRDIHEQFDRIVSVGMFEHVGYKNYSTFMRTASRLLVNDGMLLLHTIGRNDSSTRTDRWIAKYIFPNGMLPSIKQIGKASEGLLVMEDWHNFGPDYDKTLMAWHQRFNKHWDDLKTKYGEAFYRMWNYYLLVSAGAFRARDIQLWQVVFSKSGIVGGYQSIR